MYLSWAAPGSEGFLVRSRATEVTRAEDVTRHGEDVTRHGEDVTRHGEDVTRHGEDVTRHGEDVIRHGEDVTRHGEHLIPCAGEQLPCAFDLTLRASNGSPHCHALADHRGGVGHRTAVGVTAVGRCDGSWSV